MVELGVRVGDHACSMHSWVESELAGRYHDDEKFTCPWDALARLVLARVLEMQGPESTSGRASSGLSLQGSAAGMRGPCGCSTLELVDAKPPCAGSRAAGAGESSSEHERY